MKNINVVIFYLNKNILNTRTASFWRKCQEKENRPLNGESLTSQLCRESVTNATNEDTKKIYRPSIYHL